ncbi:hypothetical protein ACET3Z_000813 [Daucus carota]
MHISTRVNLVIKPNRNTTLKPKQESWGIVKVGSFILILQEYIRRGVIYGYFCGSEGIVAVLCDNTRKHQIRQDLSV